MDFVIIANSWSAARDNPTSKHQIARELVKTGHRVLWLEGAGMRAPSLGSSQDRGRIVRKLGAALRGARREPAPGGADAGLWTLAPLLIPLPRTRAVRALNGRLFRVLARRSARRLGFRKPVLINYVPVLAEAMKGWGKTGGCVVYHCVDRWDRFAMYDRALMTALDRRCRAYADIVIASSRELFEHCRRDHARVHFVSHGVNTAHFRGALAASSEPRPADLPDGALIGFIGLLSEWVDQNLLVRVARAVPDAHVVLIGKADVDIARLRAEPNIHLLGPRPFAALPRYLAHVAVGLIPFEVSELTRAVNPIKLREMLAAGCPVVSTALPEVASCAGDGVTVAANADAFVAAVAARLREPFSAGARAALSASMEGEDWAVKTAEIVAAIEGS